MTAPVWRSEAALGRRRRSRRGAVGRGVGEGETGRGEVGRPAAVRSRVSSVILVLVFLLLI
jgi:hypothetical protein